MSYVKLFYSCVDTSNVLMQCDVHVFLMHIKKHSRCIDQSNEYQQTNQIRKVVLNKAIELCDSTSERLAHFT